jgi:DNA segregation ATPase FtsK/SpoIIIE-like protein
MIYITVADRINDRFKISLEQLKICLSGKSSKSMTIIAPTDYEFLIDGNIDCDDINYFPEELNNLSNLVKYLIDFILEIVTLNPHMDATFRILNTYKEFKKIYNMHLSYFDNIDNIHVLTRRMIKRLTLIEAVAVDNESYNQKLKQFLDDDDTTLLRFWKFETLNLLEDVITFYHIETDIKKFSEKLINESSKKNIQNVMTISEEISKLKTRLNKYDKFEICHNLFDMKVIITTYLYVHFFYEIYSLYGTRKEDYIVFIPAVEFDVFFKLDSIEVMRRKLKVVNMIAGKGFTAGFKNIDVYGYFSKIKNSFDEKEKAEKIAIEEEKVKIATERLLKEEAESELREKKKAEKESKKKLEAEKKALRKAEESESKRKAEEESESKRKEEEAETKRKAEEAEAKRKSEELRLKSEAEAKRKAEEAKRKAEELRLKSEAEAKRKAKEAKRKSEELRLKSEELRLKSEAEAKCKTEELRIKTEVEAKSKAEELRINEELKLKTEVEMKRKSEELRLKFEEEKSPLLESPKISSISQASTVIDDSNSVTSVYSDQHSYQHFYYNFENLPELEYLYNDPTFYIKYPKAYIFWLINNLNNYFHPTDLAIFEQIRILGELHYAYTSIPDIPENLPAKMCNFTSYNTHLHNINAMIYNRTYE